MSVSSVFNMWDKMSPGQILSEQVTFSQLSFVKDLLMFDQIQLSNSRGVADFVEGRVGSRWCCSKSFCVKPNLGYSRLSWASVDFVWFCRVG